MADVQPPDHTDPLHSGEGEPGPIDGAGDGGVQTSTLNRPWLIKFLIFTVVLFAFGLWGLYDAMVAFPARGNAHAENLEWKFLQAAKREGKIGAAGEITDPVARFATLEKKLPRNDVEQAEYDWLLAMSRVSKLKPEYTTIERPNARLDALTEKWKGVTQQTKELAFYDLPMQWSFAAAGLGLALAVVVNIAMSAKRKYSWDPATTTLTLADGKQVRPADLADVDKTKWHKYFCTLVFADGSSPADLDVLKYSGLEEWVLTLERIRFPERAVVEEDVPEEAPADEAADGAITEGEAAEAESAREDQPKAQ